MAGLSPVGNLAVIPPAALEAQLAEQARLKAEASAPVKSPDYTDLAAYIKTQYEAFRTHRNSASGWSERLLAALRAFNGQYDAGKLQEIKKFGGSEIYSRLISQKCRSASSLLRDVYLGADRPWALEPPADPDVPPEVQSKIEELVQTEVAALTQGGQAPQSGDANDRRLQLSQSAREATTKRAVKQSQIAEDKIEEMIRQGGYYDALAEFLVDLPIFPFACIKGPTVKIRSEVSWPPEGGPAKITQKPTLYWYRVSPFDLWFTPGVSDIENANVIEKLRVTRAELNDMLDLPGFDTAAVRRVLDDYGRGGLHDNWDSTDSERAVLESRENPVWNRSGMISMMEFNGNCQGRMLQDYGLAVEDELRDYHVQVWIIGSEVIKAQLSPSPRTRHPYFITSFEKVPGTPVGNGLTDLLSDVQDAANSTLRALINNMSIASGPQVVIDTSRLMGDENAEELYPWKRWMTRSDPTGNSSQPPVQFFNPQSNAQELMANLKHFNDMADDISAIPKYMQGGGAGGAGRTASGLAMLMGNASKLLQTVSANIDRDVIERSMLQLFDLVLLTDTSNLLSGQERVTVRGVNVAIQRETMRQRQIEFLQATMNAIDSEIVGMGGRATMLRAIATTLGLPGEAIVPSDEEIEKMEADKKAAAAAGQQTPIQQAVQQGVQQGVQQATKAITDGVIEAQVPQQIQQGAMNGSLPPMQGQAQSPQPTAPNAGMAEAGAQGQGMQQPAPAQGPPQTNVVTPAQPAGPTPVAGGV